MEDNERRIEVARSAMALIEEYDEYNTEDNQCAVTDLLANLMHMCAEDKVDFSRALRLAQIHFESEKDED